MSEGPTDLLTLHGDLPRTPRRASVLIIWALMAAILAAGFFALGVWQLQRRAWKLDLIERVDQRVHAPPTAAPGPDQWPQFSPSNDEYRHVQATGVYRYDRQTFVQASTALGGGYWVLTPLEQRNGAMLLVNRGFVPQEWRDSSAGQPPPAPTETTVNGLIRVSEPRGGLLQNNVPAGDRWYSRDVHAIAKARGLRQVAPYFLDADGSPLPPNATEREWPAAGLTVTRFPNNHLFYAITWFTLAIMVLVGAFMLGREEYRLRRPPGRQLPLPYNRS